MPSYVWPQPLTCRGTRRWPWRAPSWVLRSVCRRCRRRFAVSESLLPLAAQKKHRNASLTISHRKRPLVHAYTRTYMRTYLGRTGGPISPQSLSWGTAHAKAPRIFRISVVFILQQGLSLHILEDEMTKKGYQKFLLENWKFCLKKVIRKFGSTNFRKR